MPAFDGLLREMLFDTAALCLPVLVLAALAGTAVAVLQAATQVQEQTLSLLPKLLVVSVATAAFGNFGLHLCAQLFVHVLQTIPQLVRA